MQCSLKQQISNVLFSSHIPGRSRWQRHLWAKWRQKPMLCVSLSMILKWLSAKVDLWVHQLEFWLMLTKSIKPQVWQFARTVLCLSLRQRQKLQLRFWPAQTNLLVFVASTWLLTIYNFQNDSVFIISSEVFRFWSVISKTTYGHSQAWTCVDLVYPVMGQHVILAYVLDFLWRRFCNIDFVCSLSQGSHVQHYVLWICGMHWVDCISMYFQKKRCLFRTPVQFKQWW